MYFVKHFEDYFFFRWKRMKPFLKNNFIGENIFIIKRLQMLEGFITK